MGRLTRAAILQDALSPGARLCCFSKHFKSNKTYTVTPQSNTLIFLKPQHLHNSFFIPPPCPTLSRALKDTLLTFKTALFLSKSIDFL